MKFSDFRESPEFKQNGWFILSLGSGYGEHVLRDGAPVLFWNPVTLKWYEPEAYDGMREVGYLNDVHIGGMNWRILDMRPTV